MLQPLVVGLGRSGSGLHLRTLARLARRTAATGDPLLALPVVGCDPRAEARGARARPVNSRPSAHWTRPWPGSIPKRRSPMCAPRPGCGTT